MHPQLWQACAGSLCPVPPIGAAVYYFPQGHADHAGAAAVDLRAAGVRVSPFVPCCVGAHAGCCCWPFAKTPTCMCMHLHACATWIRRCHVD